MVWNNPKRQPAFKTTGLVQEVLFRVCLNVECHQSEVVFDEAPLLQQRIEVRSVELVIHNFDDVLFVSVYL